MEGHRIMAGSPMTLTQAAVAVLETAGAAAKAGAAQAMAEGWRAGEIKDIGRARPPLRPARPARPELRRPGDMPRRWRGRGPKGRIALLHAIAHIELNAIDLACDIVARFAGDDLPRAFFGDWTIVAGEEALHFTLLCERLGAMGAAMAVGALVGSLGVASLSNTARRSAIQVAGGIGFGVTLIVFAAAPSLPFGLLALLLVGLTSNGFWALNSTLVLGSTDREYYGRVMSVYMLSWSVMPFVAMPESALADALGVQTMVAGVGVLLALVLVATLLLPGFRRLREQEAGELQAAATG